VNDLYPTKSRVALLIDVANGLVVADAGSSTAWRKDLLPRVRPIRVTAKVNELVQAGWVVRDGRAYVLTDAGQQILADGVR